MSSNACGSYSTGSKGSVATGVIIVTTTQSVRARCVTGQSILSTGSCSNAMVAWCSWKGLVGITTCVMVLLSLVSTSSGSGAAESSVASSVRVVLAFLAIKLGILLGSVLLALVAVCIC